MNWFEKNAATAAGITLKGFKTFEGGGEMGPKGGFEATAMLNGKAIASFSDDNYGGMLTLTTTPEFLAIAEKYSEPYNEQPGDSFAYFLADWHETLQQLKRKCKTKLVAIDTACKEGQFIAYNCVYTPEMSARVRITKKNPDLFIINEHL